MLDIVSLSARPALVPTVAGWLHAEFGRANGPSLAELIVELRTTVAPEETFVLLDNEIPVGTASLALSDLKSRPDLTPWLAGVVVCPAFRGRGYSIPLVRHVEAAAAPMTPTLWLYTWTAAPLYARLGWEFAGSEHDAGRGIEVQLMKRILR